VSGKAWTEHEDSVLRQHYAHTVTADLANLFGRTVSATFQRARKLGLEKALDFVVDTARARMTPDHPARASQFQKGQRAWNEGIEYRPGGRTPETQFRPGNRPQTWVPIGTYRIDPDGVLIQKMNDDPGPARVRWQPVHRTVWVKANGPVPPGHVVVFKAGRHTTELERITPDAVELVTRAELMRRNTYHRYGPEIAKVIQLRGAISRQINKRAKEASRG